MPAAIRDASLTTLKRQQRALGAFRNSFAAPGFPTSNTLRPEQTNTQTADVPINARAGIALCCATLTATQSPNSNGFQAPANTRSRNF